MIYILASIPSGNLGNVSSITGQLPKLPDFTKKPY
jgi:hypothetical protein